MTTEVETFNCTEAELDSLISHIEFNTAVNEAESALRLTNPELYAPYSKQVQWVVDSIHCNTENGRATRGFLANVFINKDKIDLANQLRCSTGTTAIPATIVS